MFNQLHLHTSSHAPYARQFHAHTLPAKCIRVRRFRHSRVNGRAITEQQAAPADDKQQMLQQQASTSNGMPTYVTPATQPIEELKNKQFDWYKAWYPLAVLEDLDPQLPSCAKLLGMDLALWYDKHAGKWRAFQDRCPHRLAPLSEGRIDAAGHLYCNYHGWQFDGSGTCQGIPQLPEGQAINPKKSCATSYPTCEREGLLWVWPDSSPAAHVESAAPQAWPGLAPELDTYGEKAFTSRHKWYFRDLPASYLAVKENAYNDCSHDTVLHHGVTPLSNRANATALDMKLVQMTPTGYITRESNGRFQDTITFPCGARRDYGTSGAAGVAYIVPTGVASTRQFHAFLQRPAAQQQEQEQEKVRIQQTDGAGSSGGAGTAQASNASSSNSTDSSQTSNTKTYPQPATAAALLGKLVQLWFRNQPTWSGHMFSHLLVDADLAMQSRIDMNRCVSDHVYMPAAVDAGPAAFLRWLREYGAGGPPVAKLSQPFMGQQHTLPATRQQLLDRFNTHTAHCKACRTAYNNFRRVRQVAAVLGLLAGAAAVAAAALLVAVGLPAEVQAASRVVRTTVGLGVAGVVCGVLWGVLGRVLQSFVFVDYDMHHPSRV